VNGCWSPECGALTDLGGSAITALTDAWIS